MAEIDLSSEAPGDIREVSGTEWSPLLSRLGVNDLYFTQPYLRLAATIEPGDPVLLHLKGVKGDVVLALLIRDIPGHSLRDAITPYGYGGPVVSGIDPPINEFNRGWLRWCSQRGIVTTFVRFHPLYANHLLPQPVGMRVRDLAGTVAWRLDAGDLLEGMHGKHRNVVRKAERAGVHVSLDPGPASLAKFIPLYEETMRRAGASVSYLFTRAHWRAVRDEIGNSVAFANAWHGSELIASAMLVRSGAWLHYHLGASSDEGRSRGASTIVLYSAALYGQSIGCSRLHLGGGVSGRDDSLLRFKRRFDPESQLLTSRVGSLVHDLTRYREMGGTDVYDQYFPGYRDPARSGR